MNPVLQVVQYADTAFSRICWSRSDVSTEAPPDLCSGCLWAFTLCSGRFVLYTVQCLKKKSEHDGTHSVMTVYDQKNVLCMILMTKKNACGFLLSSFIFMVETKESKADKHFSDLYSGDNLKLPTRINCMHDWIWVLLVFLNLVF